MVCLVAVYLFCLLVLLYLLYHQDDASIFHSVIPTIASPPSQSPSEHSVGHRYFLSHYPWKTLTPMMIMRRVL